jgi:predicted secreted protein
MIILKIYFTAIIIFIAIAGVSTALMNTDGKRMDMWLKISKASWSTLLAIVVVGSIACIWLE